MKKERKMIKKKIPFTTIYASYLWMDSNGGNGVTELTPLSCYKKIDKKRAFQILYEHYGELPFYNIKIAKSYRVYEMPIDDFIERAEEVITIVKDETEENVDE